MRVRWTGMVVCVLLAWCVTANGRLRAGSEEGFLTSFGMTSFAAGKQSQDTPSNQGGAAQGYKIAGTVVNAVTGSALGRVKVTLEDTRNRMRVIGTVTGEGGRFEFAGLPAGKYALQGARSGYIASGYEQHEQYSTAIVTGPEFATDKLVLRLMPMAMIAGHVLDESGEAVRDARVQLFMEDHSAGMNRVTSVNAASSDDRGYFDFSLLRPGTYFVAASAKPWYAVHGRSTQAGSDGASHVPQALDVAYPTTFYGGGTEAESAAAVELKGGERQEIEIRMSPVAALHIVFHVPVNAEGQQMVFQVPMLRKRVFDSEQMVDTASGFRPVAPGVYEISGVAMGRYEVRMTDPEGGETQEFHEMDLLHDGQDLGGTTGEPLGKLKVTVKLPEDETLPQMYALGLRDARQRIVALQQGTANGQAEFAGLKAGRYGIVVLAPGKQYSVAHVVGALGNEVNLAAGATAEVTAEVAVGVARIEGVVEKNGKPLAGVMVALVPIDPQANVDLFRRDQSDFDGTFSLQGVVPGAYTVVAVEDAWGFEWMKPGVLARYVQHGQPVVVGEKKMVRLTEAVEVQAR